MHFIEPNYKAQKNDLIGHYTLQLHSDDNFLNVLEEAVKKTHITHKNFNGPFNIHIFDINQDKGLFKIAFANYLFEAGNIAQNLSIIAGSIFSPHKSYSIRLDNVIWPENLRK